ncbi:MAG: MarR family winged helix-turn-helix transcriptional regulator [Chloroflexota bacterium]
MPETPAFPQDVTEIDRLIRLVSVIVRKRGRDILGNFDITPPQFNALLTLSDHGSLTMGELCDHLYLACSTATDLIDRMERNGLIERQRDQNDRRVIRLRITERGQEIISKVIEARHQYLNGILEPVSPQEKEHIVCSLNQLYSLMTQDPAKQ